MRCCYHCYSLPVKLSRELIIVMLALKILLPSYEESRAKIVKHLAPGCGGKKFFVSQPQHS